MKMTVESFDAKVKQFENKRKQINDDISELTQKEATLIEECKAAVAAGDVDTYIRKNRQKEEVSAALFVKRTFLDNMGKAATPEEAKEAWSSYVSGYDKEMNKAIEDFEAAKRALISKYENLVKKQLAALKVRDRLNESAGLPESSYPMTYIRCLGGDSMIGLISKGDWRTKDPDLVYYAAIKELEAGASIRLNPNTPEALEVEEAFNIVVRHVAKG